MWKSILLYVHGRYTPVEWSLRLQTSIAQIDFVHAETETMDESLPEEVLLDENAESEKHSFFMTGGASHSPAHRSDGLTCHRV